MIEISNGNNKPVQRFPGYFLRYVEKSAKLAKVYFICGCSSIVACVQTSPISFCFFVTFPVRRRLNASYGYDVVTWEEENWKLRPVSNVVLLPCQGKLIELNSTLARH